MSTYIYKNNQQAGPFEDTAVLEWLKNGQLSGEDFGCRANAKEWQSLKTLFGNNSAQPLPVSTFAPINANNGGQMFSNQPVVNWAKQNLQNPVKVKVLGGSKISSVLLYAFLGIFFIGFPCLVLISTLYTYFTEGWSESIKGGLIIGTVLFIGGSGFLCLIIWLRGTIATVLTSEGVTTRSRKNFLWENLYFLNYKKVKQQTSIELVFSNGKTVIPPLTTNKKEIFDLLAKIPTQRRENGRIKQ